MEDYEFKKTVRRCLTLLTAMLTSGFLAYAGTEYECDFSVNGIYYQYIPGKTNEVAVSYNYYETGRYGGNYTNYTGSVNVPATVVYNSVTYKVTAVSDHAFQECAVTSVSLPNTITSIGASAFLDCTQLYSVSMPQNLEFIGASAFNGCIALSTVSLPSRLTTISASAFASCKSLTSITIPASVTTIGTSAFSGCSNLSAISITNGVGSVGGYAFQGTAWQNSQPEGLLYIGSVAYKYIGTMPADTEVVLKAGTTQISGSAFSGCTGLKGIQIPESVTDIGASAFYGCSSLEDVTIPENATNVETYSFTGCTSLENVTIMCPKVDRWFSSLTNLKRVTLGNAVTSIAGNAFSGCSGLTTINLPEGLKCIEYNAFNGCSGLATINLPDGLKSIGNYAFTGCSKLTHVSIPATVDSIGGCAFYGCSNLSSVAIANGNMYMGTSVFYGTPWYDGQGDGLIYIGNLAYAYKGIMDGGTDLTLKSGTKSIASGAFAGQKGLKSVNLPESVTIIGEKAFQECSSLESITLPSSVAVIRPYTFYGCNLLSSITLPQSLESIDSYSFYRCSCLTEITLPKNVKSIGNSAFYGCTSLSSVTLPQSLSSIGSYSFKGCSGLTEITLPIKVHSIGTEAFFECPLTSVKVEMSEPVSISSSVFSFSTYPYVSYADNAILFVPTGSKDAYEQANVWKTFKEIVEFVLPTDVTSLEETLYAEATTALKNGNGTLPISLKNSQPTSAYSFDLVLPDGVTVESYSLSDRHNGHAETMNRNETTGVYSFAVLSLQSKEVKGNDGAILTLKLNVADNVEAGEYAVKIQNAKYSLTSGSTSVTLPDVTSLLTIEEYAKGDANGDGMVDIADAVCIVNHVVGKDAPSFVEAAADANGDGVVDIADAVRIVNLVVGKITALARRFDFGLPEPE